MLGRWRRLVPWLTTCWLLGQAAAHGQVLDSLADFPQGARQPVGQGIVPRGGGEGPTDAPQGELQRLFDAYAIVQAQEMLRLSDAQYAQFVPRLKALQATRRRLQRERMAIVQELQRLVASESAVDEAALRDRLKALADHDLRAAAEVAKAYEAIDQVLDVRQQARFRIFEARMERRRLELLLRARQPLRPSGPRRPRPPEQ